MSIGGHILVLAIAFGMYFLPLIVAALRKHRQLPAIAMVDILLGWTVLGWIGALVWALTSPATPQVVIVQQQPSAPQT